MVMRWALLLGLLLLAPSGEARDRAHRAAFQKANPCPSTGKRGGACPGYVVDHIKPLCAGGADHPDNMQWQTIAAAKEKDREELSACRSQSTERRRARQESR